MASRVLGVSLFCLLFSITSAFGVTLYYEDFSSGLPEEWTLTDNEGSGALWVDTNPAGRSWSFTTDPFIIVDSDYYSALLFDTDLDSPAINCAGMSGVKLLYDSAFQQDDSTARILAYNPVSGWTTIVTYDYDFENGAQAEDISAVANGEEQAQLRFHFDSLVSAEYWAVDNVQVVGQCESGTAEELIADSGNINIALTSGDKYFQLRR